MNDIITLENQTMSETGTTNVEPKKKRKYVPDDNYVVYVRDFGDGYHNDIDDDNNE